MKDILVEGDVKNDLILELWIFGIFENVNKVKV